MTDRGVTVLTHKKRKRTQESEGREEEPKPPPPSSGQRWGEGDYLRALVEGERRGCEKNFDRRLQRKNQSGKRKHTSWLYLSEGDGRREEKASTSIGLQDCRKGSDQLPSYGTSRKEN